MKVPNPLAMLRRTAFGRSAGKLRARLASAVISMAKRVLARVAGMSEKAGLDRVPLHFWVASAALLPVYIVATATPAGDYLNQTLYVGPALKARAMLGRQPTLDSRIRMIVLDDQSLEKIGRYPTFGEWASVAGHLFEQGFEKVFLFGVHNLDGEMGELPARHSRGELILGTVVSEEINRRTVIFPSLPAALFTPDDGRADDLPRAAVGFATDRAGLAHGDKIGVLNLLEGNRMPAGFRVEGRGVIPNMGLLAVSGLKWQDAHPANDAGVIPVSPDHSLTVDFVDVDRAYERTLPLQVFYRRQDGRALLRSELPKKLVEKLAGGRIGVLVPDGYTGARFVESPFGKVLSFWAIASLINETLHHSFLYRPLGFNLLATVAIPILLGLIGFGGLRRATVASAVLGVGVTAGSFALLLTKGWILPCVHWNAFLAAAFGARSAFGAARSFTEKMLLRRDLEMGKLVQQLLLPKACTGRVGGWEFAVYYRPYGHMAGDWWQLYQSPPEAPEPLTVLALGDVVGKGPSAALMTALIAGVWNERKKAWSDGPPDLDAFVRCLDDAIAETFQGEQNSTLCMALVTETDAAFLSIGASPWLRLSQGTADRVRTRAANPLGMKAFRPSAVLPPVDIKRMSPLLNDVFIAFTDGVIDGRQAELRFRQSVAQLPADVPSTELFARIAALAEAAGADDVLPDDFTLAIIRRVSPPKPTPAEAPAA